MKAADRLSKARALKLHQAIREILQEAIDAGSTLRIDLTDGEGSYFGTTERFWRVYERAGEPCVNCGTKIKRVVQGGGQLTTVQSVKGGDIEDEAGLPAGFERQVIAADRGRLARNEREARTNGWGNGKPKCSEPT